MNRLINITGASLLSIFLLACEDIYEGGREIQLDLPVQLKASVAAFDRDNPESLPVSQSLGVFMTPSDSESQLTASACMEMVPDTDGNLSLKGSDQTLLYPKNVQKVNFICYAPFNASMPADCTLPVDVTTPSKARESDYIYTITRNKYPALAPVKLQLGHVLSSIQFVAVAGEGFTDSDLQSMTISIEDVSASGTFRLDDGSITTDAIPGNMTLTTSADGHLVSGLIIPQQAGIVLKCNIGGMEFHKKLGNMTFDGGHQYTYDITVSPPGIEVHLREINDWIVEEY